MAGDWIKMKTSLPRDPRVVRMASALEADRLRTVGGLLSAWCLFDELTTDGKLDGYTPSLLDELIGFPGLANAMERVGWLVIGDDYIEIPRFYEHNGKSAKRRAQDSARKMSARDADKCPPDKRTECGPEKRREEKSIEERERGAAEPPAMIPPLKRQELDAIADRRGIAPECAEWFWNTHDARDWRDATGQPIRKVEPLLANAWVKWRANGRQQESGGTNGERNGTVSASVEIIRDTKALERCEARRSEIRNKYDMHMDWSLDDRKEDKQLREQIEILKRKLNFAA